MNSTRQQIINQQYAMFDALLKPRTSVRVNDERVEIKNIDGPKFIIEEFETGGWAYQVEFIFTFSITDEVFFADVIDPDSLKITYLEGCPEAEEEMKPIEIKSLSKTEYLKLVKAIISDIEERPDFYLLQMKI